MLCTARHVGLQREECAQHQQGGDRMNHRNKWKRALAVTAYIALSTAWSTAHAQAKEPVKVGLLLSFSGAIAETGFMARLGANIAAREINAAGGLLGRPIQLVEADDQSNPTNTV